MIEYITLGVCFFTLLFASATFYECLKQAKESEKKRLEVKEPERQSAEAVWGPSISKTLKLPQEDERKPTVRIRDEEDEAAIFNNKGRAH